MQNFFHSTAGQWNINQERMNVAMHGWLFKHRAKYLLMYFYISLMLHSRKANL